MLRGSGDTDGNANRRVHGFSADESTGHATRSAIELISRLIQPDLQLHPNLERDTLVFAIADVFMPSVMNVKRLQKLIGVPSP